MHACTHMNECEEPGGPARGVTMRSRQGIKGDDGCGYVGYIFRSPWEYSLKPELWLKSSKGGAELEEGQLTGPERLKWAARPSHCGVNHWRRLPNQTFLLSLCWHESFRLSPSSAPLWSRVYMYKTWCFSKLMVIYFWWGFCWWFVSWGLNSTHSWFTSNEQSGATMLPYFAPVQRCFPNENWLQAPETRRANNSY